MSARHSPIHYKQLLGDPSSSNSSSNSKSNGGGGADSTDSYAHFSLISSVAFTVNNIVSSLFCPRDLPFIHSPSFPSQAGPGMLAIPVIYQQGNFGRGEDEVYGDDKREEKERREKRETIAIPIAESWIDWLVD